MSPPTNKPAPTPAPAPTSNSEPTASHSSSLPEDTRPSRRLPNCLSAPDSQMPVSTAQTDPPLLILSSGATQRFFLQDLQNCVVHGEFMQENRALLYSQRIAQWLRQSERGNPLEGLTIIHCSRPAGSGDGANGEVPTDPEEVRFISRHGQPHSPITPEYSFVRGFTPEFPDALPHLTDMLSNLLPAQQRFASRCPARVLVPSLFRSNFRSNVISFCVHFEQHHWRFVVAILPCSGHAPGRPDFLIASTGCADQGVVSIASSQETQEGYARPFRIAYSAAALGCGGDDEQLRQSFEQDSNDDDCGSNASEPSRNDSGDSILVEPGMPIDNDDDVRSCSTCSSDQVEEGQPRLGQSFGDGRSDVLANSLERSPTGTVFVADSSPCLPGELAGNIALEACSTCSGEPTPRQRPVGKASISSTNLRDWSRVKVFYDSGSLYTIIERATVEGNPDLKSAFKPSLPRNMLPYLNICAKRLKIVGHLRLRLRLEREGETHVLSKCLVLERDDPFSFSNLLVGWDDMKKILGLSGHYQGIDLAVTVP